MSDDGRSASPGTPTAIAEDVAAPTIDQTRAKLRQIITRQETIINTVKFYLTAEAEGASTLSEDADHVQSILNAGRSASSSPSRDSGYTVLKIGQVPAARAGGQPVVMSQVLKQLGKLPITQKGAGTSAAIAMSQNGQQRGYMIKSPKSPHFSTGSGRRSGRFRRPSSSRQNTSGAEASPPVTRSFSPKAAPTAGKGSAVGAPAATATPAAASPGDDRLKFRRKSQTSARGSARHSARKAAANPPAAAAQARRARMGTGPAGYKPTPAPGSASWDINARMKEIESMRNQNAEGAEVHRRNQLTRKNSTGGPMRFSRDNTLNNSSPGNAAANNKRASVASSAGSPANKVGSRAGSITASSNASPPKFSYLKAGSGAKPATTSQPTKTSAKTTTTAAAAVPRPARTTATTFKDPKVPLKSAPVPAPAKRAAGTTSVTKTRTATASAPAPKRVASTSAPSAGASRTTSYASNKPVTMPSKRPATTTAAVIASKPPAVASAPATKQSPEAQTSGATKENAVTPPPPKTPPSPAATTTAVLDASREENNDPAAKEQIPPPTDSPPVSPGPMLGHFDPADFAVTHPRPANVPKLALAQLNNGPVVRPRVAAVPIKKTVAPTTQATKPPTTTITKAGSKATSVVAQYRRGTVGGERFTRSYTTHSGEGSDGPSPPWVGVGNVSDSKLKAAHVPMNRIERQAAMNAMKGGRFQRTGSI